MRCIPEKTNAIGYNPGMKKTALSAVSQAAAKMARARWDGTGTTEAHSRAAQQNGFMPAREGRKRGRPSIHCQKCGERCDTPDLARGHCA